ncbi:flagellar hook-length control protein FliK [Legionella jordanis]|uniref:Putative flagellar hook-length control protein n=1 Tax=Legionella jordanis TaxID=456 RepID=A0A0W0VA59_9GAMM|nr:flagellar hook-length control protein FliK [Legionella jordanis]KTD17029.1 putative flagellar hook-length control protein [Legionella jordanis]RMX03167.1 flagellar hook-length control protein FliK [Legionella jordanis]RMX18694.1 flagellar hook-length control protein FliK [Legionella jordanis]VEH12775.1 flagellar hook-length control protein FliK [Legionella jordanis]
MIKLPQVMAVPQDLKENTCASELKDSPEQSFMTFIAEYLTLDSNQPKAEKPASNALYLEFTDEPEVREENKVVLLPVENKLTLEETDANELDEFPMVLDPLLCFAHNELELKKFLDAEQLELPEENKPIPSDFQINEQESLPILPSLGDVIHYSEPSGDESDLIDVFSESRINIPQLDHSADPMLVQEEQSGELLLNTSPVVNVSEELPIPDLKIAPLDSSVTEDDLFTFSLITKQDSQEFTQELDFVAPKQQEANEELASKLITTGIAIEQFKTSGSAPAGHETNQARLMSIESPVGSKEWSEHFNDHIVWIGQQKLNSAIIRINPEELGPVEVSIKIIKEGTSLNINAHNGMIRDLIEQGLPRLKEMMTEQGINLSQVNVESNDKNGQFYSQERQEFSYESTLGEDNKDTEVVAFRAKGIVDYFA